MSWNSLSPFLRGMLNAVLIAVLGFALAYLIARLFQAILVRPLGKVWARFVASLVGMALVIATIWLILEVAGAAGLILVLVTACTGALALGSQGLAADIVGGLGILFAKPFNVGDYIVIGEYEGEVEKINLAACYLTAPDGSQVVLRNSMFTDNTIVNMSAKPVVRADVDVPVPLDTDLEKAMTTLIASLDTFEARIPSDEYASHVLFTSADDGYGIFQIRMYISSSAPYGETRMKLFLRAVRALKEAGILKKR